MDDKAYNDAMTAECAAHSDWKSACRASDRLEEAAGCVPPEAFAAANKRVEDTYQAYLAAKDRSAEVYAAIRRRMRVEDFGC